MKRIGILGGSFDPPHLGHSKICEWAKSEIGVDEIWIIPCFIHPFGKDSISFEHRMEMCTIAFSRNPFVHILDVEATLGDISLTVKTLEYLHKKYPDHKFILLFGRDVKDEMNSWHDLDRIKELSTFAMVDRGENSPIPNISATEIRQKVKDAQKINKLVEKNVAKYIQENNLYK